MLTNKKCHKKTRDSLSKMTNSLMDGFNDVHNDNNGCVKDYFETRGKELVVGARCKAQTRVTENKETEFYRYQSLLLLFKKIIYLGCKSFGMFEMCKFFSICLGNVFSEYEHFTCIYKVCSICTSCF